MRFAVALLVAATSPVVAAPVRDLATDPHPGIHYERWVDAGVPARIHLVRLDLSSAELALYATKEADRGLTTKQLATRRGAQVAINGDAFAVAGYRPRGLAAGDGVNDVKAWSSTLDDAASSVLHLRRSAERTLAVILPPEDVTTFDELPIGTQGVISGRPLILRSGGVEPEVCDDPTTLACERAPQSAVAVSEDGHTMWLAVVDGWQAGSIGLRLRELGVFLKAQGAYMAMGLDGGGASTLVLDNVTTNAPSDGVERTVANHLAIRYGALLKGRLMGRICEGDVASCAADATKYLPNAEVTLDDGRVQQVGSDAFYNFGSVTARYVCATARLAGYQTQTRCDYVSAGEDEYNSIGLERGDDPRDAGVPDAPPGDATPSADAVTGDGNPIDGGGGGCCHTGSNGHTSHTALVAVVAWMLGRRRGTNRRTRNPS
ncbi:MAG: phosphodiester glycosidase family protein [Kofleriaceae bacterium]